MAGGHGEHMIKGSAQQVMMRLIKLILISLVVFSQVESSAASSVPNPDNFTVECQATLDVLTSEEDWFERLIDPVITSKEALDERRQLYTKVHACLQAEVDDLPDDLRMVNRLTEYFLVFAGESEIDDDASTLTIVDLGSVDMEAVQTLRDKAGIQIPAGYVFLRTYTSRQDMPALVQRVFQDEKVKGATFFSRYIAILDEDKEILGERILQQQTLPETVTHELVHAAINSTLGYQNSDLFPRWFHEGVAI